MSTKTLLIRKVFQADDEGAIIVLRLVAAANDLGMLWRLMLTYVGAENQGYYRRMLSTSAYRYACRIGTLHLPDAWAVVNSGAFRSLEARLAPHLPELVEMAAVFKRSVNREPLKRLVAGVRNDFAGHPNQDAIRRALEYLADDGLMDVPTGYTGGHGDHFNVTDRIFDAVLVEDSHAKYRAADVEASVEQLLEELTAAQVALRNLAAGLVAAMYLDMVK